MINIKQRIERRIVDKDSAEAFLLARRDCAGAGAHAGEELSKSCLQLCSASA